MRKKLTLFRIPHFCVMHLKNEVNMGTWLRCCLIVIILLATESMAQEISCKKSTLSAEIKKILVDAETPSNLAALGDEDPVAYMQSWKERYELYLLKNGIDIIERRNVKRLLAEQEFSATGLTNSETIYKIGKLLEADAILFLRITWFGDSGFDEHLKLVEVATGRSVCIGKFSISNNKTMKEGLTPNQIREQTIKEMVRQLFEQQSEKKVKDR